jgi:hypothetical protein
MGTDGPSGPSRPWGEWGISWGPVWSGRGVYSGTSSKQGGRWTSLAWWETSLTLESPEQTSTDLDPEEGGRLTEGLEEGGRPSEDLVEGGRLPTGRFIPCCVVLKKRIWALRSDGRWSHIYFTMARDRFFNWLTPSSSVDLRDPVVQSPYVCLVLAQRF